MAITTAYRKNLDTLLRAAENENLALIECQRVSDGKVVVMLAAVGYESGEYTITPFAEMVDGNPFELYRAPDLGGRFHPTEQED